MDINTQVLRNTITVNYSDIERQIKEVHQQAEKLHTEPSRIRDGLGNFTLTQLLVAKAQMLYALAILHKE